MKRDKEDLGVEAVRLRRQAEARLKKNGTEKTLPRTPREAEKLLHELEVHCIELEMQNEELREKAFKYRTLIEETTNVVFVVDKDGRYDFVNHVFASAFGKPPEFFCGKTYWDVYPKELAEQRFEATRKVFETGEAGTLEVTVPLPDKTKYFLATLNPIKDSRGNVTLVLVHSTEITERKVTEEALRRGAEMQTVLREIAEAALLSPSMDELYHTVYQLIRRVLPTNIFLFNLLDETTGEIVVPFHGDDAHSVPARRPIGKGMTEYVLRQGRTIYVSPSEMDRLRASGEYLLANEQKLKMRHYLGAPLIDSQGKAFGVLSMGENQAFQLEDVEALSIIAAQVSLALERKQAKDALGLSEEKYRHLFELQDALYRISEATHVTENLTHLFEKIHESIAQLIPIGSCTITLYDEATQILEFLYRSNPEDIMPSRPFGNGLAEYIIRTRQPLLADEVRLDELAATGEAVYHGVIPLSNLLGFPLTTPDGHIIGTIVLKNGDKHEYTKQHLSILAFVSNQIAAAIDRKRSEEFLRESEQRLSDLINFLPEATVAIDRAGKVLVWNKAMEQMSGIPATDMIGKGDHEYTIPFYGERRPQLMDLILAGDTSILAAYREVGREGDSWTAETYCKALYNGRGAHIFAKVSPLHDRHGNVVGAIESIRDITDRKVAEALRHRNTQIQTILKEIAEAMVLSASMDELYRTVYQLLGRVLPAKLFHINLLDEASNEIVVPFQADDVTFIPARRPVGKGMTEHIMRLGRAVHITPEEQNRLSQTGEYELAKVQKVKMRHYLGAPLIDSQGKPFGVMSLITMGEEQPFQPQDVEVLSIIAAQVSMAIERKLMEEKSRESEQRYRTVMQQSSDAISLVDPETKRFIEVNESWVRMLGYSADEALKLSVYDIIDDTPANIDRGYSEVSNDRNITVLRRVRRKDGRIIEVERSATMIEFSGKQVLLFANRDLSAERKLQELIVKDVALASDVQKTLVPQGFDDVLVTVKTIYVPYHMVSGDFYDFAWSSDHQRLTGFILDISGHGVSSSLQGIAVSTYFRDVLDSPMRLDAKLRWVNQRVMRYFTDETYAAAIYFEFDFVSRTLHFATAGIYGFMASSADLPTFVRKAGSLVGITAEPDYNEWTVPIHAGDSFYFMSDGIFEQTDAIQAIPADDFEGAVDRLRALANELSGKDDCSAVCIRVNGALSFPHRFEFHRYGDIGRIRQRLRNLIQGVAGEEAGKIFIALGEALNNATQESMDVQVIMNRFGRRLVFRIKDGGAGFDGNARVAAFTGAEPDSFEEKLFAEGGRGILMMVSWMDRVIYNRQGNEVLLMKRMCI